MKALHVLIADDDSRFRTFLERTLKRGGFSVSSVSDGCEVPEFLATTHIDVLMLDLQMPGMNGWEVIRSMRDRVGLLHRPKIIVVSGRNEAETAAFVRRLGADAYLTKPALGAQVLATVRSVLVAPLPEPAPLVS